MIEPGAMYHSEALDLLAEASGMLASSFDVSATLPRVADLCIRKLSDYCAIYARHSDGTFALTEAARDAEFLISAADPGAIGDALREHGFETVVISPLHGRGDVNGTFVIASRGKSAFNGATEKLANVLALQIANALEQAILYDRTYRVADRLQRALLPDHLPEVAGAALHGAYRSASDEAAVGGDWYDAFALADGRFAISMGDVAGHGLEAATVMGEVRQALRTAAVGETSPSAVLEHINRVINLRQGIGMVTAIFAYYVPELHELTYAVAGHPPPILTIVDGFSGVLPGGGLPLGIEPSINASDWTFTLPARSCVVFYTDGMTEHSRDALAGEQQLVAASARSFELDEENPAIALQERVFNATANRDDAATLTLSCNESAATPSVRFSAIPLAAPVIRAMLRRYCDGLEVTPAQRFSIITAVGEAVANAVEHAYRGDPAPGYVYVRTHADAQNITIEIEDHGRWRPFQRREERGRGIVLMHELMDRVRITSSQERTIITLAISRQREEPPGSLSL